MTDFARWIGTMAAAAAAVLAAVWLIEAMPPAEAERLRLQDTCRGVAAQMEMAARQRRDPIALDRAIAETLACQRVGAGWDQALLLRGLATGGGAVLLLLLSALIPAGTRPAREAEREEAQRAEALRILVADEKRRAQTERGVAITDLEARMRAERRLRDSSQG